MSKVPPLHQTGSAHSTDYRITTSLLLGLPADGGPAHYCSRMCLCNWNVSVLPHSASIHHRLDSTARISLFFCPPGLEIHLTANLE